MCIRDSAQVVARQVCGTGNHGDHFGARRAVLAVHVALFIALQDAGLLGGRQDVLGPGRGAVALCDGTGFCDRDVFRLEENSRDFLTGDGIIRTNIAIASGTSTIGADVPKTHWAYDTIQKMIENKIVSGDAGNGYIRPDDTRCV